MGAPVKLQKLGETLEKSTSYVSGSPCNPIAQAHPSANKAEPINAQKCPAGAAACADTPSPPTASKRPPGGCPINFELLALVLGNDDRTYMKDILAIFWENVADTPEELAGLATSRDARALRDAAHSAKGATASAGAEHLADLLKRLQDAAEEEDWMEIDQIIPQVDTAFTDLEQFLQDYT